MSSVWILSKFPSLFAWYENFNGGVHALGAIYFAVQIYGDFCGYSMIAIGAANCMGFRLMTNFDTPYFSCSIQEFWRRWHISLSSFFRDYLYIPLGGSRVSEAKILRNLILAATISGLWHGANWTFVLFGLYNGLLFIPLILSGSIFKNKKQKTNKYGIPSVIDFFKIIGTFMLITLGFIIFRADNIGQAWEYISGIYSSSLPSLADFKSAGLGSTIAPIGFALVLFVIEWISRSSEYPLAQLEIRWKRPIRYIIYYIIIFAIIYYSGQEQQFIYFQF